MGKVTNESFVRLLEIELDAGEAEALALALELKADLVLLDERRARRIASRLNLRHIGLLGVLIEGKRRRHLESVKPVLDALISAAGFWVSSGLYDRVIEVAGE